MRILSKTEVLDGWYKLDIKFKFIGKVFNYKLHSNYSMINRITLKDLANEFKNHF